MNVFWNSLKNLRKPSSMNVHEIKRYFELSSFEVDIKKFSELDLSKNYKDYFFLYQSSEINGSAYKIFIEDLIYHLENQGAIVLPKFKYLKAHSNKVFMELLRFNFQNESLKTLDTKCFGTVQEAKNHNPVFPVVIKRAWGSSGNGVYLAKNKKDYNKYIAKAGSLLQSESWKIYFSEKLRKTIKSGIKILRPENSEYLNYIYIKHPPNSPFIIQSFIPGLKGDYKVLIFGKKYFTLYRENRDNDFRASGSGKLFVVNDEKQKELLNFARKLKAEIDFPIIGLDAAFDGNKFHLIEFQMMHLGPYTLQASKYWHEYIGNQWVKFSGQSNLEKELVIAISNFIRSN